jgi:AMP-polyphosphate phosphotransferase
MLENIDLKQKTDKETYKKRMADLSDRLYFVQQGTWAAGIPVIILFEGWDAAGKGTTIHTLTDPIDPRGYKIYPIRAARTYEKKHPWLWRFWLKIPARGEWAIFDRSWYGRVLVERMEKLISKEDWENAYRDIVDFERNLADDGALIIKFFMHISKKEQGKRFEKLADDPLNSWRVTAEDWRNHKRYKKWRRVYEEMLERTETEWGPWTIVEATDRRHTQVKVYETIITALEERLGIKPEAAAEAAPQVAAEAVPPTAAEAVPQTAAEAGDNQPAAGDAQPPSSTPIPDGGEKKTVDAQNQAESVSRPG